ncbi:spore cortex protein [Bacillus pakistanensis]|uniref:Spore cortex protein n=1 Tax=Rossellomorea pakistanensis TaxID=992288 RepID=A0ABS2NAD8_9BACI|nr:YhcN/YlaJ family sporulation lipoprotein [Bacillus pakistanensis]MBM7584821.1 spore cortex protein [Bacillus pakistanensis]
MNRKRFLIPITAVMVSGLSACNTIEDAAQNRYNDTYEPIGYYSNEGHGGDNRDERDGPVTELYDHSIGREAKAIRDHKRHYLQARDENGNPPNPSTPLSTDDRNFLYQDNRASHGDANYHGHLNGNIRSVKKPNPSVEGEWAEKIEDITASVENVNDVRSVSFGSDVMIAVDLNDHSKEEETKREIKNAVQPYIKGRSVTVVTDEGIFSRVRNNDNDVRDGINFDIHNMFNPTKNR